MKLFPSCLFVLARRLVTAIEIKLQHSAIIPRYASIPTESGIFSSKK